MTEYSASPGRSATPGSASAGARRQRGGVTVHVPASSANLGPGFDSLGLALGWWDRYDAAETADPGLDLELVDPQPGVPEDERHLVVQTMRRTFAELGEPQPDGLWVRCANTVPQGRGLGSSAAAIVAGIALAQALIAVRGDGPVPVGTDAPGGSPVATCGADIALDLAFANDLAAGLEGHPDNSSASVFGGLTISWVETVSGLVHRSHRQPVRTEVLPLDDRIAPVVFVPGAATLSTATARAVLPSEIPHRDAALNSARAALLTTALTSRPDLLLPATREWLHQEQRRTSFPAAMTLVDTLREAGHAAAISGAGPSVLVLTTHDAVDAVRAHAPTGWEAHAPGVPGAGVRAERATFDVLTR